MVADIEAGKISTGVVKDMSRVGRDYLQTGYYTEVFFPQNKVRFIAIANSIDSSDRTSGEIAPFLNIMNEWYLRDISRKIRQALQVRASAGLPLTTIIPYGYTHSPEDKHKWVIDEEAAAVADNKEEREEIINQIALLRQRIKRLKGLLKKSRKQQRPAEQFPWAFYCGKIDV